MLGGGNSKRNSTMKEESKCQCLSSFHPYFLHQLLFNGTDSLNQMQPVRHNADS